jgi:DNA-binding response OmpR family regulator
MGMARVLVADDQPNITRMLRIVLQKAQFEVLIAQDGAEALNIFVAEQPDIVILDLNMPGIPGWEVCRRIKAQFDTPILIITGLPPTELKASQLAPGADAYLIKPFDLATFLEHVRALLAHHAESLR